MSVLSFIYLASLALELHRGKRRNERDLQLEERSTEVHLYVYVSIIFYISIYTILYISG